MLTTIIVIGAIVPCTVENMLISRCIPDDYVLESCYDYNQQL